MRYQLTARGVAPAGLAALAAALVVVTVVPPAGAGTGPAAPAAAVHPSRTTEPVLLINGDQLLASARGSSGRGIGLPPGAGPGGLLTLGAGGKTYEIPVDAAPYLGRGLDPSLFELTAVQQAEAGGRLPVRVTFAGRRPPLPGVTITRAGRRRASGYLTVSSARAFGAALARQFRADHARGSYGTDGMFAGHTEIALAGAPPSRAARPDFPMQPLTVTGANLAGHPDTGDFVVVLNVDNVNKFGDPVEPLNIFYHGVAKYSVPAGHYWAYADFMSGTSQRVDVLPQFTVRGSTTVHLAARAASSEVKVITPRPAVPRDIDLSLVRRDQHGLAVLTDLEGGHLAGTGTNYPLWVSPTTSKPTVGTLQTFTSADLTSPKSAPGIPYAYNLDFAGPAGIIPRQRIAVAPASLATVHERYYQDGPVTGEWGTSGGLLAQDKFFISLVPEPVRLPGRLTQYLTGGRSVMWASFYSFRFAGSSGPYGGQYEGDRPLLAGQQVTENWNQYPLHPQPTCSCCAAARQRGSG